MTLHARPLLLVVLLATVAAAQQRRTPARLHPGIALYQQKQYASAAEAFEKIVIQNPEDGQAWFRLGLARHSGGELDLAIRAHMLALHFAGPPPSHAISATYNVACVYALQNKAERSLMWLHRARNAGFKNLATLGSDTDLRSLRDDERFVALCKGGPLTLPPEQSASVESITKVLAGGTGGIALAGDGTMFVANFGADVWIVEPDGSIRVHATGFTKSADCTMDHQGNLIQVDFGASKVWRISAKGEKSEIEIRSLNGPVGIDHDRDGSFYLTNFNSNSILHAKPDGTARVVASGGLLNGPNGLANAGEHGLFVANYLDGHILHVVPNTGEVRFLCTLPGGGNGHLAWAGDGLYVTDRVGHRVFHVTLNGGVTVVAGSGARGIKDAGAATSLLSLPNGIAMAKNGKTLFINNRLSGNRSVVSRILLK